MGFEAPGKWLDACEMQSRLHLSTEMSQSPVLIKAEGKSLLMESAKLHLTPINVVPVYRLETFLQGPMDRWQ